MGVGAKNILRGKPEDLVDQLFLIVHMVSSHLLSLSLVSVNLK